MKVWPALLAFWGMASVWASQPPLKQATAEDYERFATVMSYIRHYYVDPVSDKELLDNAIRGMLSGLDPHSMYLDAELFGDLDNQTKGHYGGIGLEISHKDEDIVVVSPLDDSPAARVGVNAGDKIIEINGDTTNGETLPSVIRRLRGPIGEAVEMVVSRGGEQLRFAIPRERIIFKTVVGRLLDGDIVYVQIRQFQEPTTEDFIRLLKTLNAQQSHIKGLILDLRDNPGGVLDAAVGVSDALIHNDGKGEEEEIVETKSRVPEMNQQIVATSGDILSGLPIVVLMNQNSASAAEIVAGALQDNHRAVVMGTRSFGKGTVQTIVSLGETGGIKMTTARYYTPSGRSIHGRGIQPDIQIESSEKDGGEDVVLERAKNWFSKPEVVAETEKNS